MMIMTRGFNYEEYNDDKNERKLNKRNYAFVFKKIKY